MNAPARTGYMAMRFPGFDRLLPTRSPPTVEAHTTEPAPDSSPPSVVTPAPSTPTGDDRADQTLRTHAEERGAKVFRIFGFAAGLRSESKPEARRTRAQRQHLARVAKAIRKPDCLKMRDAVQTQVGTTLREDLGSGAFSAVFQGIFDVVGRSKYPEAAQRAMLSPNGHSGVRNLVDRLFHMSFYNSANPSMQKHPGRHLPSNLRGDFYRYYETFGRDEREDLRDLIAEQIERRVPGASELSLDDLCKSENHEELQQVAEIFASHVANGFVVSRGG